MTPNAPIHGTTVSTHLPASQGDAGNASLRSGTFRNEQVQVTDQRSALLDAMEEISMHFAEKVEEMEHDQREVEAPRDMLVMKAEQIEAYLAAAKLLDGENRMAQLVKLAERMLQADGQSPARLARQNARNPDDPTERFILLQFALEHGKANGAATESLERVEDAIRELQATRNGEILAGLNTVTDAASWGQTPEEIQQFQQAYRDVALGGARLSDTLKIILERLSGDSGARFGKGLQTLMSAVGADLAATRPSTDPTKLQVLRHDMDELTVFNTLLVACEKSLAELKKQMGGAW